ncbi:MAG TPA: anti-sigma factor [Enhygromyxa sp.]|nr:anti-sigma factor [Enhygromyxa sp.]
MSDPQKRIHTLLTDRAIAGLTDRELEELDALLDGEAIDPSYELAAAAIELSLLGHVEPLPGELEAVIVEQADRYWGFAELRPREPTLGGAGHELLLGSDADATPIRRIWERSPDNYDELVLESSLTNGRIDRIGPGESLRGEILPAAEEPSDQLPRADPERDSQFDSEVDAQLAALAVDDDDERPEPDEDEDEEPEDEDEPEPAAPRPRKRSRPHPHSDELLPRESQAAPIPHDYRIARWATYISAIAALTILAIALWLYATRDDPVDPDELTEQIDASKDKLEWSFTAKADPRVGEDAGGSILWSSELQGGIMTLHGLAANEPTTEQYQLWIVDREREGPPVDGGVFDVPAGEDQVRIPVDAKLLVGDPAAFIITVEQPGGVVVSRQDRVMMVAAGS